MMCDPSCIVAKRCGLLGVRENRDVGDDWKSVGANGLPQGDGS